VTGAGAEAARVLLVTAAGERGGAEATMERIARRLPCGRFPPLMAAPEGSALLAAWRSAGFDTAATPVVARLRSLAGTRAAVRAIAAIIEARGISLVHTHGVAAQVHAGLAARRQARPVVSHAQDMFDRSLSRNGLLHRIALAVPRDMTIACSAAVARSLGRRGAAGACEVIPNPVDTTIVAPVGRPAPLVVWCGRLQRWKGCHLFLRAAARVLEARPDARFAVVGGTLFGMEPGYPDELRHLAASLRLGDAVEFVGHVDDARPWMRAAAVVVHSSERPEPFGLVMAEAMTQERPVAAFDHGGAAEIVVDGETGRLVPVGDTEALARAVVDLLRDDRARERMGDAARRRAVECYSAESVTSRVEAVYARVLARRSAG
jgi:glycosyltransferase involved in cell wall biosynthesis